MEIGKIIDAMVRYNGTNVQRVNHSLKVYAFAKAIGELEELDGESLEILECAAVLHDIGIKESERKYNSFAGNYQQIEGPPIAREMLTALGTPEKIIERVCFLIAHHHTYTNIDGSDYQILIEADFLVNIFEDGMARDQIEKIATKHFKTTAGIDFIRAMYLS